MLMQTKFAGTPVRWQDQVKVGTGGIAWTGYIIIAAFMAGFGYWGFAAKLGGAAIAQGYVAAAGRNVMIQHLEGGIISDIKVHEGDTVKAGQPLISLDGTQATTLHNRLTNQLIELRLKAARLRAERDCAHELEIGPDLAASIAGFNLVSMQAEHVKEFTARLARFEAEQGILGSRVDALKEALEGLAAQKKAGEDQLLLVREEIGRKKDLLEKGLTNRSEYTALLRTEAELIGQVGALQSQIASSITQTAEAREQIERLKTQRVEDAVGQLNTVRVSIRDMEEQVISAEATLERTEIRSPIDGIVVRSLFNATGSVIRAGEPVIEILPTTAALMIEARVSPRDIDAIRIGQVAEMKFTALNSRMTPEVAGTVTYVSADRQLDPKNGEPYYTARLRIAEDLPPEVSLSRIYPGMPVETYFMTDERTFADYLVRPVLDSFSRAFREE